MFFIITEANEIANFIVNYERIYSNNGYYYKFVAPNSHVTNIFVNEENKYTIIKHILKTIYGGNSTDNYVIITKVGVNECENK
jgi:hypothetical protein